MALPVIPIPMVWRDGALHPIPTYQRRAAREYVEEREYLVAPVKDRSSASHNHYFACVRQAWLNLPEGGADRFATEEHLRKYALIKTGNHDSRSIPCANRAEALRVASFIKPMDPEAVIVVSEATVTVYTAKSQSRTAMGPARFQRSKEQVLGFLSDMIGVEVADLMKAAA